MSDVRTAPAHAVIPVTTEGVLGRRLVGWLVDVLIVSIVSVALWLVCAIVGLITFGIGWHLFALLPLFPLAYAFLFLASPAAATPGQALMGVRAVHHITGARPSPVEALVSTLVFYLSMVIFFPILAVALFTERNRTLHDLAAGLVIVRTQPLTLNELTWNMRNRPRA